MQKNEIQIGQKVELDEKMNNLLTIIYDQLAIPKVESIIGCELDEFSGTLSLIKGKNNRHYLLVMLHENIKLVSQEQKLIRLISLSNKIVCLDLNNQRQSSIQKTYLKVLNDSYRIQQSTNKLSLCFINPKYHQKKSLQAINYYHSVQAMVKAMSISCLTHQQLLTVTNWLILYYLEVQQNKLSQIRLTYEKLKNIQIEQQIHNQLKQLIFAQSYIEKISRNIEQAKLKKKEQEKLLWKYKQMKKWKKTFDQNKQFVQKYNPNQFIITELNVPLTILWITQCKQKWIHNSFKFLKQLFNKIANRRDYKTIEQFRVKGYLMVEKLEQLQLSMKDKQNEILIVEMYNELKYFLWYHECGLNGDFSNSICYLGSQLSYLWHYNPKIYQKLFLLILILIFIAAQNNPIVKVAILGLGLILIAIRL